MSVFAALDALMMDVHLATFGDPCTLYPMKPAPGGRNDQTVADDDRTALEGVPAIRSEWSERQQIGGQGMPTPTGAFKLAAAGFRHVATVKPADLSWTPGKGDELEYSDRPGLRYRISEPMPDGLAGLHLGLTKV